IRFISRSNVQKNGKVRTVMRSFRLNIVLRLAIITGFISLMVFYLLVDPRYLRSFYILLFLVVAFVEFFWYIDKTNRDFKSFLLALLQNDFTTRFSEKGKGKSFNEFYTVLNRITDKFEDISSQKQAQHIYLESLVEHVKVGIISFDDTEKIQLVNQATKDLLGLPQIISLKTIQRVDKYLLKVIREIKPGENRLVKLIVKNEMLQLNVHASEFKLQNRFFKLVSLQNIKNALDENELAAWQKLIRVLTHEIMNSVTPITSLSGTLKSLVDKKRNENKFIDKDSIDKLWVGLDAVENRSKGLQSFTTSYRKLTKIPTPVFESVKIRERVNRILELFKNETQGVNIKVSISNDVLILADPELLDQVLINMIKNALDAMTGTDGPQLSIGCTTKNIITISDNGSGIEEDKLDQIFIPFFTTKKDGSGIGLALSQQIMHLHKGKIDVHSEKGIGTTFNLRF
ncbi:MAG: ATP-binding protein, partial [Bacteroidota bacterium]